MNTYTTRDEAVEREIIDPLNADAKDFDIDAIADEVIGDKVSENGNWVFYLTVDTETF